MKSQVLPFLAALVLVSANAEEPTSKPAPLDWNQAASSPRGRALEVAADQKSLGYHLRDGFWSGDLQKEHPVIIAVHLFAGNDYWFTAANLNPGTRLKISIFDRWGNAAGGRESEGQGEATAGISPVRSGRYYVRLAMTEGDKAETCMVYSYK
ncbi:MAG: hypothetical protein ACKOAS_02935 [Verrucomicrobiota bacterium]